jgi:RNA-directed DNA polymerase
VTEGEKQMTTAAQPMFGASPPEVHWDAIDRRTIEQQVLRLQMRIAKATREGRWGKVNALQWLLTHSYAATLLAVRRVTHRRSSRRVLTQGLRQA